MNKATQRPEFKAKYHNYIKGKFTALVKGEYSDVLSSLDGKIFAKSGKEDLELAVDAAYKAFKFN